MSQPTILAASPCFAGPGTRPYRYVLLSYDDKTYSVHMMFFDDLGGIADGQYYTGEYYATAIRIWSEKTMKEIMERGPRCFDFTPLGEVQCKSSSISVSA